MSSGFDNAVLLGQFLATTDWDEAQTLVTLGMHFALVANKVCLENDEALELANRIIGDTLRVLKNQNEI